MKKFRIQVIRTDEYEIEVDEKIYDEKALAEWSDSFSDVSDQQELAECLARQIMNSGSDKDFLEGFGYVKTSNKSGRPIPRYGEGYKQISEEEYTKGISVKILYENEDYDCETEEID